VKLRHLDRWNARRRRLAELYASLLPVEQVTVPSPAADDEPVFHVYPIEANDRDGLRRFLRSQGIETGIHYPVPIHLQPASAALGHGPGAFPVSEAAAKRLVSLPMFPELAEDSVEYVAKAVTAYVESR
jgi:dTDP-4-amino-4,6-dideoxygalactose transaminase